MYVQDLIFFFMKKDTAVRLSKKTNIFLAEQIKYFLKKKGG